MMDPKETKAAVGRGMIIAAALMAKRGEDSRAQEIIDAAGYSSWVEMRADKADEHDIEALLNAIRFK